VIKTRRWNDPAEADDGYRLLVCRYRPRGVPSAAETWDAWLPQLGPSKELHAAVYGKGTPAISWEAYTARYVEEMDAQRFWIKGFGERAARGEPLTLLCSSACVDPARCHRTLLRGLIARAAAGDVAPPPAPTVVRRVKRSQS
jgi:uncharacterized protein YeaO (DUF488 family)